jgi:hypothetical protein
MKVAPKESVGLSCNSTWMAGQPFVQVLKHTKYIVLTSIENSDPWCWTTIILM